MAYGVPFLSSLSIMEGPPVRSIASLSPYVVDCDPGPAGMTYSILAGECTLIGISA